jgi:hypothetical protein
VIRHVVLFRFEPGIDWSRAVAYDFYAEECSTTSPPSTAT